VVSVEPPLTLPTFRVTAIVPKVSMRDEGVAWLVEQLVRL
jgi:hypothetical protein